MKKTIPLLVFIPIVLLLGGCGYDSGTDNGAEVARSEDGLRIRLNDTGVDWCANLIDLHLDCPVEDHPGQDAEFGRDLLAKQGKLEKVGTGHAGFDFTKLDEDGEPLAADAKHWACVRDNHSGLEWEVKTTDGSLQHHWHTYTWFNPDPTNNGGDPGVQNGGHCTGSPCDTLGYTKAVNQRGLCGHNDWRVPSAVELNSIVDFGRVGPALDTDFFPNAPIKTQDPDTEIVGYWTTDQQVILNPEDGDDTNAIIVKFFTGETYYARKSDKYLHLRLVRGGR